MVMEGGRVRVVPVDGAMQRLKGGQEPLLFAVDPERCILVGWSS